MAILTKRQIQMQMDYGNITVEPFSENQLTPNGYDLHLGRNLLLMDCDPFTIIDPLKPMSDYYRPVTIETDNGGNEFYTIHPGMLYLGITAEYTESLRHVPIMEGKSSLARMGVSVHHCAGFGDIGFCGHWTLEITCKYPIRLYVGMPIGQIVWHTAAGIADVTYLDTGSYNNSRVDNPMPGIPNLWKKQHQFITVSAT